MSASPLPDLELALTREFWAGAARSELMIPRCAGCDVFVWYPSETCPKCASREMPWVVTSGRGTLFSWCVVDHPLYKAFAEKTPYLTGLVALAEDPRVRLVTLIEDCAPEDLEMEMPMRADFRELSFPGVRGSVIAPFFVPDI